MGFKLVKGGLQLGKDATMTLGGKKFMAWGTNCFNLLNESFAKNYDVSNAYKALDVFKEYDVRVVRFNCGGFYEKDWKSGYFDNEDKFFGALDRIVKRCEELNIGLIPSFFWTEYVSNIFDEPFNLSIKEGMKTNAWKMDYSKKLVERYAESPAILMWEYGNERNLDVNIQHWQPTYPLPPNSKRTKRTREEDMFTIDNVSSLYERWSKYVKSLDPYKRLTGTGDAVTRPSTYHQYTQNMSWEEDTFEQHVEAMKLLNPDGMDAISAHEYSNYKYALERGLDLDKEPGALLPYVGVSKSWYDFLKLLQTLGKMFGKTCYIGEFGCGTGKRYVRAEYERVYRAMMDAALKLEFPMCLYWNYDYLTEKIPGDLTDHGTGIEYSCNERWEKGKLILELIREINAEYDKLK